MSRSSLAIRARPWMPALRSLFSRALLASCGMARKRTVGETMCQKQHISGIYLDAGLAQLVPPGLAGLLRRGKASKYTMTKIFPKVLEAALRSLFSRALLASCAMAWENRTDAVGW